MLGENLKYLRLKHGLSQDYIAKYLGKKSFTTVQKWESGISEPPLFALGKLSELYQTSMDDLYYADLRNPKFSDDTHQLNFSEHETTLIKKYRCLPPVGQESVDAVLNVQYNAAMAGKYTVEEKTG